MVLKGRMIDEFERIWKGVKVAKLKCCPSVWREWRNHQTPVRIDCVLAEIQTRYSPNRVVQPYHYSNQ
jgi:hypothetical protein